MGTRSVTVVKSKGKVKVCQYCQWDGNPTGEGKIIANFLKNADINKFAEAVDSLGQYTDDERQNIIQGRWECLMDVSHTWAEDYPELSRDTGADILELIYSGEVSKVYLTNYDDMGNLIEYEYIIDLDTMFITLGQLTFTFDEFTRDGLMEELERIDR